MTITRVINPGFAVFPFITYRKSTNGVYKNIFVGWLNLSWRIGFRVKEETED